MNKRDNNKYILPNYFINNYENIKNDINKQKDIIKYLFEGKLNSVLIFNNKYKRRKFFYN